MMCCQTVELFLQVQKIPCVWVMWHLAGGRVMIGVDVLFELAGLCGPIRKQRYCRISPFLLSLLIGGEPAGHLLLQVSGPQHELEGFVDHREVSPIIFLLQFLFFQCLSRVTLKIVHLFLAVFFFNSRVKLLLTYLTDFTSSEWLKETREEQRKHAKCWKSRK